MNIPEVRFPEFTEEWEKQKLSNILEFEYGMNTAGKEFDGENKYIRITDIEESSRKFLQTKLVSPEGKVTEKYRVKFGDILFARTGASTGKTYKYIDNDGKIYFAGFLIRGRVDKKTSVDFIFYLTLNYKYKSWINVMSMRSGQPGINAKEYGSYEFRIPKIEEQQKIGDFFTLLDKRIEQQEQKIALLKDYKKAMMQKIFSQKIRFKDDNGNDYPDWEEKKLGKICRVKSSQLTNNVVEEIGKYPVYGANSIVGYTENYEVNKYVSIVKDGAGVGRIAFINNKSSVLGTLQYLIGIEITTEFLYVLLSNVNFKLYQTGTTIPHIYFKDYSKMIIDIPCQLEQEKISSFLFAMDLNLENQEAILNNLKEQKQGLLRKMFV